MDRVHAAAFRLLISRTYTTLAGGVVMAVAILLTLGSYTTPERMLGWLAAVCAAMGIRIVNKRRFDRAAPSDEDLGRWERAYVRWQLVVGICWGSSAFLFIDPARPLTVLFTVMPLAAGAAGAVAGQAASPRGFLCLAGAMLGLVGLRLALIGTLDYLALAIAWALYAVTLFGYNRLESRIVLDSFRMRFENEALVEALRIQTQEAEDARQAAEAASLAKSQFLAAASHDLRQPLYALSLFSATLRGLSLDEAGRRVVDRIGEAIARMETLFSGLLDLSRLQAGVVEARALPLSVDALFDGLEQVFFPIAQDKGLALRFRSDGEWVSSDPVLLEQLMGNLVGNALRYTERGAVLVAARRRGDAVRLEVWDTGLGIAEEDRARIFDEFVQVGNAERDRTKGLGLGLSIVQRAARLLGTRVELASRPGRGSRFVVTQPAAAAPTAVLPRAAAAGRAAAHVLVVDDEAAVRDALVQLLTGWGLCVESVPTGDAAAALVAGGARFDHVLCDQRLPGGLDGLATLSAIAHTHAAPAPAVTLVTGDVDPALVARAHAAGVDLLQKPVAPATLRARLGLSEPAAA